jgi:CheY-like chemotaxis protein
MLSRGPEPPEPPACPVPVPGSRAADGVPGGPCCPATESVGLAAARAEPFDLVLCDLGLPDLGGHELARRLRRHPRRDRMRLVAVSGFSQPAGRDRSLRAGFDAHLVKPMTLADLEGVLAGGE